MTTIEIIRLVGKEFSSVSDSDLLHMIDMVKPLVSKSKFGKLYNMALAYLICHKLKMAGYGDDGGFGTIADSMRVSSYSEGSRSVSFGGVGSTASASDAELGLTIYGMQYLDLRRLAVVPITIAGAN